MKLTELKVPEDVLVEIRVAAFKNKLSTSRPVANKISFWVTLPPPTAIYLYLAISYGF